MKTHALLQAFTSSGIRRKSTFPKGKSSNKVDYLILSLTTHIVSSSSKLLVIWQPTFGALERWKLFMSAPVTLFYANSIVTFCFTAAFTAWYVWIRLEYMLEQVR